MKKNKEGILGQTIYRPKIMDNPGIETDMPRTSTPHHEEYLDDYSNLYGPGIR